MLNFEAGREFDVVAVSFNPKEGPGLASQKKQAYVERYSRPQAAGGLALPDRHAGDRSRGSPTRSGFRYEFDAKIDQYAHGAGDRGADAEGRASSQYFYGIEFSPRDLRLGLIEASDERIGTVIDDVLLLLLPLRPGDRQVRRDRRSTLVRIGGVATVLAFVAFLIVSLRRERAARNRRH